MSVFIDTPPYPDVPFGTGIPPVRRQPGLPLPLLAERLFGDAAGILSLFLGPQWGIFDDSGSPVAVPDTVVSVDYRQDYKISDYPVEQGGFESYDKVTVPYDARVRFAVYSDRAGFLEAVASAAASLDLYTIVTPDAVYSDANIVHVDYTRSTRNGVSQVLVDVWLEEVRQTGTTQFAASGSENTRSPSGSADRNGGTGQTFGYDVPGNDSLVPGRQTTMLA